MGHTYKACDEFKSSGQPVLKNQGAWKNKKVASMCKKVVGAHQSPEPKSYGASRQMLTNVQDLICDYNHIINAKKFIIFSKYASAGPSVWEGEYFFFFF